MGIDGGNQATEDGFTGPHRIEMPGWISNPPFGDLLHFEIVEADGGRATLAMPFLRQFAQGAGFMHGGAIVSLADTAIVVAIKTLLPPRTHFGTTSLRVDYLYPVRQGIVRAEGRVLSIQERVIESEATVTIESGREVARVSSTCKIGRDSIVRDITYHLETDLDSREPGA